ncbi:MAG TPA: hypothetical protein DCZ95_10465 [Verrucomicrobia bacterium]|nr:hypothetical protein [Verrucomicrobiota bacterium]
MCNRLRDKASAFTRASKNAMLRLGKKLFQASSHECLTRARYDFCCHIEGLAPVEAFGEFQFRQRCEQA